MLGSTRQSCVFVFVPTIPMTDDGPAPSSLYNSRKYMKDLWEAWQVRMGQPDHELRGNIIL